MTPAVGQKFGPYEILGRLGRGGMGLVYRAWDGRLHREVAIKLLHHEYPVPGMRERFLQEARAASALSHPNICTVFDIGDREGVPYLVMELMHGETLRARIDGNAIPVDEMVQFTLEIADALGAAHARGIVHRDIKPANIFLCDRPTGGQQAKVLDFGLAKVEGGVYGAFAGPEHGSFGGSPAHARGDRNQHLTSDGATVGTVAYMSPEQARGEPLDARTDLFSLGVVMYEMATRRVPFQGSTSALMFVQLLNYAPELVRDWNDAVPRDFEKIILKLLMKDPAERFQSASELAAALHKMTTKSSGSWLKRAALAAVPLVRAPDPVARERRPIRRPSDAHASGVRPVTPVPQPSPAEPLSVLRPVLQIPVANGGRASGGEEFAPAEEQGKRDPGVAGGEVAPAYGYAASAIEPAPAGADVLQADPAVSQHLDREQPATLVHKSRSSRRKAAPGPASPGRLARRRRRHMWMASAAVLLPATIVGIVLLMHSRIFRPPLLTQTDDLLITAIENRTGDKALDGTVAAGLEMQLDQSPYFALRGREVYRSALRQLGAVVDQPPNPALARQAAVKAGAKAYVYGNIRQSEDGYILSVDVLDAGDNRRLAGVEDSAASREQIPQTIDRIAERLRSDLGEEESSITSADVPLAREATSDLDALHEFTLGQVATLDGRTDDALAAYQAAAKSEPRFIQAQMELAWLYRFQHAEASAAAAARLAQAANGQTSTRTNLLSQYTYEVNASGDLTRASAVIRQFMGLYPHDPAGSRGLARVLRLEGRLTEALEAAQQGIAEDASDADLYGQAEYAYIGLDRYDSALGLEQQAQQLTLAHDGIALTAAYLAGKEARLSNLVERVRRPPLNMLSLVAYGLYLDNVGQIAAGGALWRNGAAMHSSGALAGSGPWMLAQGALDRGLAGDCDAALDMARAASPVQGAGGAPGMTTSFNAGMAGALCGDKTLALRAIAQLSQDFPQGSTVVGYYLPDLHAAIALGDHDPQFALEVLKTARPYDLISLTPYLRGLAHVELHQMQVGIVDFQTVLGHRGIAVTGGSNVYPMAQIALARAFAESGDKSNSRQAYKRFLELWSGADPGQRLKSEAQAAVAR